MFQNLKIRWVVVLSVIIGSFYFVMPTYELYSINNDPDLIDIDIEYLKEDAIKLGLDLQGGLYIVLELDYFSYLLSKSNKELLINKKEQLSDLIQFASNLVSGLLV